MALDPAESIFRSSKDPEEDARIPRSSESPHGGMAHQQPWTGRASNGTVYPIDHSTAMQELQNINEEHNEDNSRRSRSVLLSAISEN